MPTTYFDNCEEYGWEVESPYQSRPEPRVLSRFHKEESSEEEDEVEVWSPLMQLAGSGLAVAERQSEREAARPPPVVKRLRVESTNTKQWRQKVRAGNILRWLFSEASELTVGLRVVFVAQGVTEVGSEREIVPLQRAASYEGTLIAECDGEFVFLFDNVFSWWTNKDVTLRIEHVAPSKALLDSLTADALTQIEKADREGDLAYREGDWEGVKQVFLKWQRASPSSTSQRPLRLLLLISWMNSNRPAS